ncbi:hypothetical protein BLNAU_16263 [Blattamonas nauphoetae]|uniref:Uncharacterized protein n=1 Tax=Blattamonas nauphoetae TaxID=2049346 RepID=A0ABQ9XC20_9EUKA|nr:hypothetical protein BLNAU_16263 [Blattamonas nauphoetae]
MEICDIVATTALHSSQILAQCFGFSQPSCSSCSMPSFPSFESSRGCACSTPSVPQFNFPQPSPCALPQQSPCALPAPTRFSNENMFNAHNSGNNRQASQDHMRANADCDTSRQNAAERCNAQRAKALLDADVRAQNHRFSECNENEFLCHNKKARTDTGDCSAQTAKLNADTSNACQAAQRNCDSNKHHSCAGRDATTLCEAAHCSDASGLKSASGCGSVSPCGF